MGSQVDAIILELSKTLYDDLGNTSSNLFVPHPHNENLPTPGLPVIQPANVLFLFENDMI